MIKQPNERKYNMTKDFEKIIFDSDAYTYDDAKKYLIEEQGIENPTDEEIYDEMSECNRIAFKDERLEFACRGKDIEGTIIAIGDIGSCNGRKDGIKVLQGFEDVMDFMTKYDSFKIFKNTMNIHRSITISKVGAFFNNVNIHNPLSFNLLLFIF